MRVVDFHFDLSGVLIARHPLPERRASRLLTLNGPAETLAHKQLTDFLDYLRPGNLVAFNNTRVIPAHLFGQKGFGGKLEALVGRILDQHRVLIHIRASRASKPGARILVEGGDSAEMLQRHDALFELTFAEPILPLLGRVRHMPLPPYIGRPDDAADRERYQTIYAQRAGAVAVPITGLHFNEALPEATHAGGVDTAFVTPHVGAGTSQPMRVERIEDHVVHHEWLEVGQDVVGAVSTYRAHGGRVVAIGTTSMRSLKSTARNDELKPFSGDTDVSIFPGRPSHVINALIADFHLPESALLMLVSAFAGYPETMAAYVATATQGYRFFGYGDAIFITHNPAPRGPED